MWEIRSSLQNVVLCYGSSMGSVGRGYRHAALVWFAQPQQDATRHNAPSFIHHDIINMRSLAQN
jgi:hypothetical protein